MFKEEAGILDSAAVCTNMLNAAYAVGLGSCWIHRCKEVFETLEGKQLLIDTRIELALGCGRVSFFR